jgi:hypothetical protein
MEFESVVIDSGQGCLCIHAITPMQTMNAL